MSDDELVERIRRGDADAAEELVRRYYASILRYCRNRCVDRERAEDLAQETFLRLFTSLAGYRKRGRFRAFLYTIAEHLCIDECRRLRQYPLEDPDRLAGEDDGLLRAEDRAELDRLLAALSPEQRTAVVLRFGEQLSFREIGAVMGCSLRTAQSRVRWGLENMRRARDDER